MAKTASVTLRGRFPAGTKVELRERRADFFSAAEGVVKTATVKRDRSVVFDNLPEGARYWVSAEVDGQVRSAMVTAKAKPEAKELKARPSSAESRPADRRRVEIDRPKTKPSEITEDVHQRDVPAHVVQRSATPLGMATPMDPDEVAGLPQSEVPKGVFQRSATPHGYATVIPDDEVPGGTPQEDASGLQRSDTPEGEAKPQAKGLRSASGRRRAAVKAAKDRDAEPAQKALRDGAKTKTTATKKAGR